MPASMPWLLAFSLRDRLAMMSWLELILWFGLASLTLALLILMGTRWGQVRPVSKCVALSVFAHVLFLAYAYGTNLSFSSMGLGWEPTIRVSLTDASEEDNVSLPSYAEETPRPLDLSPVTDPLPEPVVAQTPAPDQKLSQPESLAEPDSAPALLATPMPAASMPPPLLPDPELFDPSETVPEAVEIVDNPPPAPAAPEVVQPSLPEMPPVVVEKIADVATTEEVKITQPVPEAVATSDKNTSEPVPDRNPPSAQTETKIAAATNAQTNVPRRPVDDQPLPDVYRLRTADNRLQLAIPFGATERSEAGVQAALQWLELAQSSDGRWDASDFGAGHETKTLGHDRRGAGENADTGITGLALLAFLGAGNTHVQGDHRETVQRGLQFLLRSQASDGNLAGDARVFEKMYCHGIALLALSEAFALTGDPRLQPTLRDAVAYSVNSQHPTEGGWRYQPGDRGDISQFGWQVMALRSAEVGGIPIDAGTRMRMLKFLESATSGQYRGLASYRPGERTTRTMTAEAMSCRFFLESPPTAAAAREATDFLLQELPGRGQSNLYYWYYATMALYQDQGPAWTTWNDALQQFLLSRQRQEGRAIGSWDTDDVWGGYGGRVYTTAMATLCLEVYYRYLPLYEQLDQTRQAEAARAAEVRR